MGAGYFIVPTEEYEHLFTTDEEPPMSTYETDDLAETVAALHATLNGGNTSPDMLMGVLTTLEELTNAVTHLLERDEQVTKAVRRVQRETRQLSTTQALLARATQQGLTGVKKALGTTGTPRQKVRKVTPTPAPDPRLSPELVKSMGKTLVAWFGPGGGRVARYDPSQAARMVLDGTLTQAEATRWKRFARVPDRVRVA